MILQPTLVPFIWKYLKQKKCYLLCILLIKIVWSIEVALNPYLLKVIIDLLVQSSKNSIELYSILKIPVIIYILVSLISNLLYRFNDYICSKLYSVLRADITRDLYSYLINHSYIFFQNNLTGSVTKKVFDMASHVEAMIRVISESFIQVFFALISSFVILLITVHWMFSAILLTWAIFFVLLSYIASKKLKVYAEYLSECNLEVSGQISDSISNIVDIKLFLADHYEIACIDNLLKKVIIADFRVYWENIKISFIQTISITVLVLFLLVILVYGRAEGFVSVGDFALVITLSISILSNLQNIGQQIQYFSKIRGMCCQGLSIIQSNHRVIELPNAKILNISNGSIKFKHVRFSYTNKAPVFNNLNLTINPGEKVGLIGYSGAGKSTLLKLILRFMDVQSGGIFIDNYNIQEVTVRSLLNNLTIISQESQLFHRSIMENIKFAKPGATNNEIIEAAKEAKCHDFICTLPDGYKSLVGKHGVKLSGGQRQMLAIARAFLKNSSILLLDEATSAVDSVTEYHIQQSLYKLMKNKTTIAIAHRLSTLEKMDRILVLDRGKIVADGNLQTLINSGNDIFTKLWKIQIGNLSEKGPM